MILQAIDDYHEKTAIRFKQYDPQTEWDYVHITGEYAGCWSHVGRLGGVSSKVQGVVTESPALQTTTLGFRSPHSQTPKHKPKLVNP